MNNNSKIRRETNYEILRMISCIAVIMIHVSAIYINKSISSPEIYKTYQNHMFYIVIINTISRFAVPCFLMMSGAFLIENSKNKNRVYFYEKKIVPLLVQIIIFSILYFIFLETKQLYLINFHHEKIIKILIPIKNILIGAPHYHMWYMYMLIILYPIIPILIDNKEKFTNRICIIILFLCIISGSTSIIKVNYGIANVAPYIGYLIIGYKIRKKALNNKNNKIALLLLIIGISLEILLSCIVYKNFNVIYDENTSIDNLIKILFNVKSLNPIITISSVLIFAGFSYLNINVTNKIETSNTLYIYLIHAFVIDILNVTLDKILVFIDIRLLIIINIITTFLISLLLTKIYLYLYKKLNKNEILEKYICKIFKIKRINEQ